MNLSVLVLPLVIFIAFTFAFIKKVGVYDCFISGVNEVIPLLLSIFPYVCTVLIMSELCEVSGLTDLLCKLLKPLLTILKIPPELTKLIIIKPLSGSGSLALLSEIYSSYGAESYIAKCASCIFGSSETVFYIGTIYFSTCKSKDIRSAIVISLIANFLTCIFACFICRIL